MADVTPTAPCTLCGSAFCRVRSPERCLSTGRDRATGRPMSLAQATPVRDVAPEAVCSRCGSHFCLVRSESRCITLRQERGESEPEPESKALGAPPRDKMLRAPAASKAGEKD